MYKEKTLATFTQEGIRLQLLKITNYDINKPREYINGMPVYKYQVRLNRKIQGSNDFEYPMRKLFANICQNIILQLKIF